MEANNIDNKWHLSKYNIFAQLPNEDRIICFNLLRGSYSTLTPDEIYRLHNFKEDDPLFNFFVHQKFIVNYNELQSIEMLARKQCGFQKDIKLTICPTFDCNFDCPYCFEEHRTGKMNEQTQDQVITFIERLIDSFSAKKLVITWFGGEPLLYPEIIESLSKRIIKITNEKKVEYGATIITNGYLLNQSIIDRFSNFKINSYQITLDGLEEIHDKTRHLKNGGPTFNKIIDNLCNIKTNSIIKIRHNVYSDNISENNILKKYIEILSKKTKNKIIYYPALITTNDMTKKRKTDINFLEMSNFSKFEISNGVKKGNLFRPIFCGAQTLNFIVIDELGNLYKCWEDINSLEFSYGNVDMWDPKNPIYTSNNPQILINYINTGGIFKDKECLDCVWLPVCAGGCPHRRLFHEKVCISYKNKSNDFIFSHMIYRQNKNNKNEQFSSKTN